MNQMFPNSWRWVPITTVSDVIRGVSFDSTEAVSEPDDGLVPILRAGNIEQELIIDEDLVWVPRERVSDEQLMRTGDIAICMSSGSASVVGKTAQLRKDWFGAVGAFCAIIRPNNRVESDYLGFVLQGPHFEFWRRRLAMGANIQNLRRSDLESALIPLPPLSEQRRIVAILDEARTVRWLRRQADDLTAKLIPAIFHEMFGDPIGAPKTGKKRPVLAFVKEMQGGKSLGEDPTGTRYRVVKVSAVTWGKFQPNESKYVSDDYEPPKEHFIKPGDLLFSRANTPELVGATVLVHNTPPRILLSDKIWRFVWRNPSEIDPLYALALFQHPSVRREMGNRATGTGGSMKNISKKKLLNMRVAVAPYLKQKRFAKYAQGLETLRLDPADVQELTESILTHAFSGELTAGWRKENQELLEREAAERDTALKAAGVKLAKPSRPTIKSTISTTGRYEELNREQRELLRQLKQAMNDKFVFTLSSIRDWLEEPLDGLPEDTLRRHLDVLAARGLVRVVSRKAEGSSFDNTTFGNVYRLTRETSDNDNGTLSDLTRMEELIRMARHLKSWAMGKGSWSEQSGTWTEPGGGA